MADSQTIVITVEASGEVTPAPKPETEESPTDEEMTDG